MMTHQYRGRDSGWVVSVCAKAGSNPCPPIVIGVGIGGDFEKCAYLAKKALCRSVSERNPKKRYAELEAKMLEKINLLGIGPQGFGGTQDLPCSKYRRSTDPYRRSAGVSERRLSCDKTRKRRDIRAYCGDEQVFTRLCLNDFTKKQNSLLR